MDVTKSKVVGVSAGRTLAALSGAALLLPACSKTVNAAPFISTPSISLRISQYSEDRLRRSDFANIGDQERYDIDVGQVQVKVPINEKVQLTVDAAYEDMSGASPWFVVPENLADSNSDPVQVMSGATIDDQRLDLNVKADVAIDEKTIVSPSVGFSTEDDYDSVNFGVEVSRELNKSTTVKGGAGVSLDSIEPRQDPAQDPGRVDKEDKQSYTVFAGVSQVINKNTVVQTGLSLAYDDGYLSDPYKLVYIEGVSGARDQRPDDRFKVTWSIQMRHWAEWMNAALIADYRFYYDDWDVYSHTLDLGIRKHWSSGIAAEGSIRYYTQTEAEFYDPFFTSAPDDGYQSSDYRLSPYGAFTFRGKISKTIAGWTVGLSAERYISDSDYSLESVDVENPGLVDFTLISLGMDYQF